MNPVLFSDEYHREHSLMARPGATEEEIVRSGGEGADAHDFIFWQNFLPNGCTKP